LAALKKHLSPENIAMFLDQLHDDIAAMERNAVHEDVSTVSSQLHTLAGSAGNIGA
jgi:HPt (histidine-containing phosphotransfer) domain-containing protein